MAAIFQILLLAFLGFTLVAAVEGRHHHRHHHHHHRHHHKHHHHHHHNNKTLEDAPPVLVEVYYETLCPDSRQFIAEQLAPTIQQINSIMNVSLIPYGKAHQKQVNNQWVFTCQHGPRECVGNIIESCAIKYLPPTMVDAQGIPLIFDLVICMEAAQSPPDAGPDCAKKLNIQFDQINTCSNGDEGNQLEHLMGLKTESLDPKLTFVPWISINSVHTDAIQSRALYDLLGLVCDNYTGAKPSACNE